MHYTWVLAGCAGVLALLVACRPVPRAPEAASPPPGFSVTVARAGDRALVGMNGETPGIAIESPGGIGAAEVRWPAATPPAKLQLQLYLGGLEELRLRNGATEVIASVASRPPCAHHATSAGVALSPGDALWPTIERVPAKGGDATRPRQGGYFLVTLPPPLLAGETNTLHVAWIDFYR